MNIEDIKKAMETKQKIEALEASREEVVNASELWISNGNRRMMPFDEHETRVVLAMVEGRIRNRIKKLTEEIEAL